MRLGTIIIIIALLFDQITKHVAMSLLSIGENNVKVVEAIPYVLRFSFVKNTGASFGIGDGLMWLFYLVTVIALGIFFYLFKDVDFKSKKVYSIAISLFIAGALGNFIDRIALGYVIDFMHYPFLTYIIGDYGSFYNNWADMYLSAAMVLFMIDLFFLEPKRNKKESENHENNQS
jgi:signal peptidase II